jgi:hypothetical protein
MEVLRLAPATAPPAGRQRRGSARGVSAWRTPRGTPPDLARRGEISTKTQKLRPALPCEPLPNHVLPLAHFGAISDVRDGGVVRTDHHNAGERSGRPNQDEIEMEAGAGLGPEGPGACLERRGGAPRCTGEPVRLQDPVLLDPVSALTLRNT